MFSRQGFEDLRDYFLTTPDDQTHIWDFPDGLTSEILVGNQDFRFNDASWWITIIDPYRGRQPVLLNRELFLYGRAPVLVRPIVLLDSQVVNALHTYVISPDVLNIPMREAIRSFISFVKDRFDFSPIFYYAEMAAKSHPEKRALYARERATTLFALQTMDVQQFSQTGRVVPDPAAQAAQLAYSGVGSVEELISRYAGIASNTLAQECTPRVDCIYASLLKIALVQRQMRGDILAKYRAVRNSWSIPLELCWTQSEFWHSTTRTPTALPTIYPPSPAWDALHQVLHRSTCECLGFVSHPPPRGDA